MKLLIVLLLLFIYLFLDPIYCPALSVQYGNINVSGPYTYGTVIGYTCQTGFQLVGVSSQTCLSSGDWSDEVPYCTVLNCTDPGIPDNGGRLGSDFTNGSVVSFNCTDEYSLQGSEFIYCYRGNWSNPLPQCQFLNETSSPTSSQPTSPTTSGASFLQLVVLILVLLVILVVSVCCCSIIFLIVYRRFRPRPTINNPPTSTLESEFEFFSKCKCKTFNIYNGNYLLFLF